MEIIGVNGWVDNRFSSFLYILNCCNKRKILWVKLCGLINKGIKILNIDIFDIFMV